MKIGVNELCNMQYHHLCISAYLVSIQWMPSLVSLYCAYCVVVVVVEQFKLLQNILEWKVFMLTWFILLWKNKNITITAKRLKSAQFKYWFCVWETNACDVHSPMYLTYPGTNKWCEFFIHNCCWKWSSFFQAFENGKNVCPHTHTNSHILYKWHGLNWYSLPMCYIHFCMH